MTCNVMSNDSSSSAGGDSDSFCWSLIFFLVFSEKDRNCIHFDQSIRTATIATEIWSLLFGCSNGLVMLIWSKLIY